MWSFVSVQVARVILWAALAFRLMKGGAGQHAKEEYASGLTVGFAHVIINAVAGAAERTISGSSLATTVRICANLVGRRNFPSRNLVDRFLVFVQVARVILRAVPACQLTEGSVGEHSRMEYASDLIVGFARGTTSVVAGAATHMISGSSLPTSVKLCVNRVG